MFVPFLTHVKERVLFLFSDIVRYGAWKIITKDAQGHMPAKKRVLSKRRRWQQ